MKKLRAIVTKKDGTTKEVYVVVDNQTAEMLAQLNDEKMVNDYLAEEYKMFMAERNYHRNVQSLDKSMDGGFELEDKKQDVMSNLIDDLEKEELKKAIKTLTEEQQWLIVQYFYERRTQTDIANEIGIDQTSIRDRLRIIYKHLKKILQS